MKQAYPNFSDSISAGPSYDLGKWMRTMKDVYVKIHFGASRGESINQATNGWNSVEKRNFIDWMKYYESGDHNKYKKAQHSYYVNDDINYFLPNPPSPKAPSPIRNMNDQIAQIPQEAATVVQKPIEPSKEDQKRLIEDHRRKLLGRLNSAEKLLSSHQGQMFAGPDFERLLSAIYDLKKQIQTVNKMSLSAQTCVDLIIRQANILNKQGFQEASKFMVKFAQNTPGDFSANLGEIPAGGSQPQGGGSLGNNFPSATDLASPPPQTDGPTTDLDPEIKQDLKGGIDGFLANMEGSGVTLFDDDNEIQDEVSVDDDVILDEASDHPKDELIVYAQEIPAKMPITEKKAPPIKNVNVNAPKLEDAAIENMTPEQIKQGPDVSATKGDADSLIDSAFANLTVADVIIKLEEINKIFRNREISRQLAIVDVMLNRLGIAPYFPTLAEATAKQLDANQYCLTRIEDILSKLRGTQQTAKIDLLEGGQAPLGAEKTQQHLENADQKEKSKKEMKKQVEETNLINKMKPSPEVEEVPAELAAQPTTFEAPKSPAPQPRQ